MEETYEQQLDRVLNNMVARGEIKTIMINGEVHYYIEKNNHTAPPELQKLIDTKDTIKIFKDGDVGFPQKYSAPTEKRAFIASTSGFEHKKDELIRRFKALL